MSATQGRYRIGVDVGGTFTDAAVFDDAAGSLRYAKVPSTPADPARAVLDVLERLGVDLGEVQRFIHGITIGTNAVLEGRGAEVWMLTTAGFRDVLEIARTNRTVLYDITALKPPPLVPRGRTLEIDERMAWDGSVLRPLDLDQARAAVESLPPGVAVAVCFLHSYANPDHERAVAALVREGTGGNASRAGFVTASCEVLPEFREYERFNTTALNAYIGPLIDGYLARLQAAVAARGYRSPVFIMTSNGGVATAERARRLPVATVLSGPAGGVAAAANLGQRLDLPNLITCDMGGTSTDVCLIEELVVPLTNEQFVGPYANRTPQTEINAVGAGGGSIAWMDSGDILMVGPRSAGADPGPACYGQGGREPTVTDANVVLHRLKPGVRLAGRIALDEDLARRAVRTLGLEVLTDEAAAEGVVRIAVARMVSAIKQISVAKGHDPRDFTLVAYGGAGPMHGAFIAEELEIERVLVPTGPGNFAALGSLISDVKQDFVRTRTLLPRRLASFAEIADEFGSAGGGGRPEPRIGGSGARILLLPAGARHALPWPELGDRRGRTPGHGHRGGVGGRIPRHPRTAFRASQRRRDRGGELPADRDRPGRQARVRRVARAGRPRRRPGRDAVRVLRRPVLRHPGAGAGPAAGRGLPRGAGDRRGGGRHHRGAARVALPGARLGRPVDGER